MRLLYSLLAVVAFFPATFAMASEFDHSEYGPNPALAPVEKELLPTMKVAKAVGWKGDAKPIALSGFEVMAFARGLDHPRWIHVLPNGDVLVAESNKPAKQEEKGGIKQWIMGKAQKRAGAGVESADRITLLRDADGDGVAETKTPFLENLYSPFGMSLSGEFLYVANTDAIVRFPYKSGDTKITAEASKVFDLPAEPINHHWTKDVIASPDGKKLYATVGSNSNVGENGIDKEEGRAAVWEIDLASGQGRLFATGLRNPNGLSWNPEDGKLWVAVNERDELGNKLVPDYMTSVKDGAFYGWPYSYYGQNVDERVKPPRPDLVARAILPDYALGAHTASLGLTFYTGNAFPRSYKNGAFVGQHGSWNRDPAVGYGVIFVPFEGGKPSGMPQDFLTGFLDQNGNAQGRPVGVAVDKSGALLVADDVGNVIWRVTPSQ